MTYDCAVIGAGLSGLASAIILSKNGLKTALIEKSSRTAPLVRGFKREGHYFDTGFHHAGGINEGSTGRLMLDYLGISQHLNVVSSNSNYTDMVRFRDSSFEFRFPVGIKQLKDRLEQFFPGDINFINRYINEINRQCSLLPFLNLNADIKTMNILENVHGNSLADFLSHNTDNPYLQSVLTIHSLLNGVPPGEQGLNNYAYIVGPYYESVSYIEGGGSALVAAYEKAAKENGVDIFLNREAQKLIFSSSGELKGTGFKDGAEINAKNIISTIHPSQLMNIVPENLFRPSYNKRIKTLDETPSAFILYGTSEIDLKRLIGSNLYLVPADGNNFGDFSNPIENRPINIIISNADKKENIFQCIFIMICPASINEVEQWGNSIRGKRPQGYLEFKDNICRRMLDYFVSYYPELKGKIHAVDFSTPLTLKDYSGSPFGSMYGAKHRIEQYNPFPMTSIKGLYLAGQSIVAPGLLGTLISAFLACGNILGHDYLRGALKVWNQEE
ncbi:MAG: NAD(P)/FAD-dependent oxidoreductase [Deltaproteobacteria bacterium]|nr:NAD(P)/FAD-dependent oxidoreductase [Deltaproteobacteria bacterium]